MIVKMLHVGPLQTNCYIVGCEDTKEGAIIDPGGDAKTILAEVERLGLKTKYVINTHGHFDHTLANKEVVKATGASLAIHAADAPMLTKGGGALFFGIVGKGSPPADTILEEGQALTLGKIKLQVLHTPGHSPGSVCLYSEEEGVLFDGDVLFNMGMGRYDLPGGDYRVLMESIQRLLALPDETTVYPGHGPATTIGRERRSNPFLS
ncbi:MAG: MBL fold metallo-hydrolase [Anaerolineales bacterium]|nr:MBL fold metallo-hydrolase [Anaerolineales bacterium]